MSGNSMRDNVAMLLLCNNPRLATQRDYFVQDVIHFVRANPTNDDQNHLMNYDDF